MGVSHLGLVFGEGMENNSMCLKDEKRRDRHGQCALHESYHKGSFLGVRFLGAVLGVRLLGAVYEAHRRLKPYPLKLLIDSPYPLLGFSSF